MFSVIIPLYNKENYITQTIKSVLIQTFKDFEIIIVNDGSTDKSIEKVKYFDDTRIRLIEQTNTGVSVARNKGIKEAKYDLIAFLDADDLWDNDFLLTAYNLYNKYPNCDIYALNYRIENSINNFKSPIVRGLSNSFKEGIIQNYFVVASQSDPIICSSSVIITKNALNFIGGFPTGIRAGEDLLTWARLASQFDVVYTTKQKATFNRTNETINSVPRIPDSHNYVGEELLTLASTKKANKTKGIQSYIAFWHKIRLANFLRLKDRDSAKSEFKLMSKFAKKDLKYFTYAFLVYSPKMILKPLTQFVLYLNTFRRKIISRRETQ